METVELESAPGALSLYPRVALGALRALRALPFVPGGGDADRGGLPGERLAVNGVEVDRAHLEAYQRVCTFPLSGSLPLTYPHMLGFGLSLRIMASGAFPFPALGLVHVANRIERRRAISVEERLDVEVWAESLRDHPRGRQFDVVCSVATGGEEVWRETSTYLRRGGGGSAGASGAGVHREPSGTPPKPQVSFSVPGGIGRRYAAVSGDRNPIHMHPLAAKAFGMPTAIAHGMWLKARTLAILDDLVPDAVEAAVEFKLPVRLPARVSLASWGSGRGHELAVTDARTGKPHLRGTLLPVS